MIFPMAIIVLLFIRVAVMQGLINNKEKLVEEMECKAKVLENSLSIKQMYCEELQSHVDYYKLGMEETIKENISLKKKMNKGD